MNSSTSTSEKNWRRFFRTYVAWALGIGIAFWALLAALDPYDTGRFALFGDFGVPQFGQRLADASLGRNPQFNAAIIGNSSIQIIDPARLNADGIRATSLAIPGTGPREQLTVAEWFVRHHPDTESRALVIGISRRWCKANQDINLNHPFPFWLYSDDTSDYLLNLMQLKSFEAAGRKIGLMLGITKPLPVNGYNDYDLGRTWSRAGFLAQLDAQEVKEQDEEETSISGSGPPYHFEAALLLKNFLAHVPTGTTVVLVMPPRFHPEIGLRQSEGEAHRACRAAFEALTARRPHTTLIDFLTQPELTSREEDYWDRGHYRAPIARKMEEEIKNKLAPAN